MDSLDDIVADLKARLGDDSGLGLEIKLEFGAGRFVFVDARAVPHEIVCKDEPADCCLSLSDATYRALTMGRLDPVTALRAGRLSVTGERDAALRFLKALAAGTGPTPR